MKNTSEPAPRTDRRAPENRVQTPSGDLDQRRLVLSNSRPDVVAIAAASGWLISSTRYSSYSVPYNLSRTDHDGNGVTTIDDIFIYLNAWFSGC